MTEQLETSKKERGKLHPDDKKNLVNYNFDEGVRVALIPPDQVFVEFSALGLAFNDLFRYIPAYGQGKEVSHEKNFEERAISYARSIVPNIRVKRATQVKLAADNSVSVHLFVQRYPNHITSEQQDRKSDLPYAGWHSQDVDVRGLGLGAKGQGFPYANVKEPVAAADKRKKAPDNYKGMQNASSDAANPTGEMKQANEKLYRVKEAKIKISQNFLKTHFEEVDA